MKKNILGLTQCTKQEIEKLTLIHYGKTEFLAEKFGTITNRVFIKPSGGLWTSPIDSEFGWKDWCECENFRSCTTENSFTLKFKPKSKILVIDTLLDLESIPMVKGPYSFFQHFPNFELISKCKDAIWLTINGEHETRLSHPYSLYGWDCESVLILNPDCVYQVKNKENFADKI